MQRRWTGERSPASTTHSVSGGCAYRTPRRTCADPRNVADPRPPTSSSPQRAPADHAARSATGAVEDALPNPRNWHVARHYAVTSAAEEPHLSWPAGSWREARFRVRIGNVVTEERFELEVHGRTSWVRPSRTTERTGQASTVRSVSSIAAWRGGLQRAGIGGLALRPAIACASRRGADFTIT